MPGRGKTAPCSEDSARTIARKTKRQCTFLRSIECMQMISVPINVDLYDSMLMLSKQCFLYLNIAVLYM